MKIIVKDSAITRIDFCCKAMSGHLLSDNANCDIGRFKISMRGQEPIILVRGMNIAFCPFCGKKVFGINEDDMIMTALREFKTNEDNEEEEEK